MKKKNYDLEVLQNIIKKLRDPIYGCPWDKKQTIETIAPLTIEESYELAEAITKKNKDNIIEELGDLLFHILLYAEIGKEKSKFDINSIARSVSKKMIERHPHVFKNKIIDEGDLFNQWEKIKSKKIKNLNILDSVSNSIPPLRKASKIQNRVKTFGFEWKETNQFFLKLLEEIEELKKAINDYNKIKIEEEIGDVLFTLVNLSRKLDIDPEIALMKTNNKFIKRFNYIENQLRNKNIKLEDTSLEEMNKLWNDAKLH
mgnify:CR=1 FL=1